MILFFIIISFSSGFRLCKINIYKVYNINPSPVGWFWANTSLRAAGLNIMKFPIVPIDGVIEEEHTYNYSDFIGD